MKVKICGIRNENDLSTAIKCNADAVGFVVGTMNESEDSMDQSYAKKLVEQVPPFISSVLVTELIDPKGIAQLSQYLGVQIVQLHGELSHQDVQIVREKLLPTKVIKVVHIMPNASKEVVLEQAHLFQSFVDAILVDTRTIDKLGGTGLTHDWNISRYVSQNIKRPLILAGGLNPFNIQSAIRLVLPYGVDVNSGVEDENGNKSFDKCLNFIEKSKAVPYDRAWHRELL
jgi:phosphoribosylanthranilate isomerase